VYVADFSNNRIQVFTDEGKYVAQLRDSLRLPTDVAVDDGGTVFVADYGHGRIARFRRN
jgi:DNA-binding beta-propeller fold protein YncE